MQTKRSFTVALDRDGVVEALAGEDALLGLLPDSQIVASSGDRRTIASHYTALGKEGVATFHFDTLMDGSLRFEKVCDGRVWRELRGELSIDDEGSGARITIEMNGRTKSLVPEFAIKGPMEEQIDEMSDALAAFLDAVARA